MLLLKNFDVYSADLKKRAKADADEMLYDEIFEDDEEYGEAVGEDGPVGSDDENEVILCIIVMLHIYTYLGTKKGNAYERR